MNGLNFHVEGARAERHAAVPTLIFDLDVEAPGDPVENIVLRCQIRIEPHKRRYTADEERRLLELFGETPRWGDTLKPFLWTHVSAVVTGFSDRASVELAVPCTYDLDVAAAKYMHSLDDGEIPTIFLFSGTVFRRSATGMRIEQVPWDKESHLRLPVRVWRDLMDAYFPKSGWMRLRKDTLDALMLVKAKRALATWDDVVVAILRDAGEEVRGD